MLSIFFIIVSVSVSAVSKNAEKKEIENFLEQLSSDFYYAQIFAISNGLNANTSFVIDRARSEYKVQSGIRTIFVRQIPSSISYQQGSLDSKLTITQMGHVSAFGNWRFTTKNYKYAFVVLIGRGRHYYYEF